jgi:hypothetical protein
MISFTDLCCKIEDLRVVDSLYAVSHSVFLVGNRIKRLCDVLQAINKILNFSRKGCKFLPIIHNSFRLKREPRNLLWRLNADSEVGEGRRKFLDRAKAAVTGEEQAGRSHKGDRLATVPI